MQKPRLKGSREEEKLALLSEVKKNNSKQEVKETMGKTSPYITSLSLQISKEGGQLLSEHKELLYIVLITKLVLIF